MTFDEQLDRTFESLVDRLREDIARELEMAATEVKASAAEERTRAAQASATAARQEAELAATAGLADAVAAAEHAARSSVLETSRAEELAAGERLAQAVRGMDRARSLSEILDTLASCAGREAARVGVLISRGDELQGWRFIGFGLPLDESPEIRLDVDSAGIIGRAAREAETLSGDSSADMQAPSFARLPEGREMLAVPIPMSGQVVALLYADQGRQDEPTQRSRAGWPLTLEVLARHAARCLEAVTAFRAAQVLTERPDVAQPVAGGSEDERAARRYAKLLISEIKLYHEADVLAGRRERDLAVRLGGEIARARTLYEQRIPAAVRQASDYFQSELVAILADGDRSLVAAEATN